jgi:carboxyl-terminal processing protease
VVGTIGHAVSAVREKIMRPVASARMLSYHHVHIGYLRLTGFTEGSGDELRTETDTVLRERSQALILDLRANGGGLMSEAINVASIFIPHGTIMSAAERNQPRRVYEAQGNALAGITPNIYVANKPHLAGDEALAVAERTVAAEGLRN